jgi:hypothetical protein
MLGILFISAAFAQEAGNLPKGCESILKGEHKTLLKNAIQRNKDRDILFESDLMTTMCPGISKMKTEEEKIDAVIKVMAVYSAGEVSCQDKALQSHVNNMALWGGKLWLPMQKKYRGEKLAGTPCDVVEMTPNAQAECALYLATLPNEKNSELSTATRASKWPTVIKEKSQRSLYALAPNCNLNADVAPKAATGTAKPGALKSAPATGRQ